MALMQATHTIEGFLAVETHPRAFVAENGHVITRLSATKWGGWEGLEILEYSGDGQVEVSDEQLAEAEHASQVEAQIIAEAAAE
ncbi:hypothetical protein SEA_POMAR16_3 [Mycobacterium phage Pomar16]|uniref:hypothetical protein n=1 Tax=Mycobacterium phage Chy5 TaxID=1327948 RepID=UPI00032B3193|nr:hypothetical protein M178_gp03 [Mycobacterium phage Chy5]YP_008060163.1 hypothetical protein M179_gp03 [Mycobacterium phage Chy4]AOQ27840.1 hypothetical protein SEA_POMAR16_3 [Mycobacterium phage Pomar16]AXH48870.1 hypothetical protein SEA_TOMATHAN_3 [Mycobacterium phage Tomathan]AGK85965.1 hypothetical protein Chy4_003 [Mycobacterium phage Chy4]AGK86038.1 hypothetical protein Chy5_003 [Mycobacterium phage Chy5]